MHYGLNPTQDLANALQSAQPKIQKMCEEESDDQEAVAKLLEINDSIHRTVERYKLVKKGDLEAASKIPKGTLGTSTGVSKTADSELSLIDFDGDSEPSATPIASQSTGHQQKNDPLEDDLLGLSFQDNNYGQSGGIALGFGANTSKCFCNFGGHLSWWLNRWNQTFPGLHCFPLPLNRIPPKSRHAVPHLSYRKIRRQASLIMILLHL